jgi:hypothetical protein
MRIDATNDSYAGQGARIQANGRTTSFSAVMNEAMEKYSGRVDFTHMTRQELMDWANGQYFSGEMTMEESRIFMLMTVRGGADVPEDTRYDFMQLAREGIEGALWHKDEAKLKLLESGLQIMRERMSGPE